MNSTLGATKKTCLNSFIRRSIETSRAKNISRAIPFLFYPRDCFWREYISQEALNSKVRDNIYQHKKMTREEFIEISGGVFTHHSYYRAWGGKEKRANFWAFYDGIVYDEEGNKKALDEEILSIYAGIRVDELLRKQKYSIEHIIPKSFLRSYLTTNGAESFIKRGATTNPFNFAPAHRSLNTTRSSFPFDFDGDKIVRDFRISLEPNYTDYGMDFEMEWVVPTKTRGDIARAILYMSLVYNIREYYGGHLKALITWAKQDVPTFWEKKYNEWVKAKHGINNPFIHLEGDNNLPYSSLLDDSELLNSLLLVPTTPTVPVDPTPIGNVKDTGSIKIIAALVNPLGEDEGQETVSIINTFYKDIDLQGFILKDKMDRAFTIKNTVVKAGCVEKVTIHDSPLKLSNKGGEISLFTPQSVLIHQVEYEKVKVPDEGHTLLFD